MKKHITIILLFFVTSLFSEDFEFEGTIHPDKPYLFVSLGCNCWQAQALRSMRAHSLRDAAFPFDWLFTLDNDKLIKCLDEKFENFLNETYFLRYEITHLENTYYNFKFTHDWPSDARHNGKNIDNANHAKQMGFIKQKYSRRINRFINLKSFKGKVFFIRCFQTDPNYQGEEGRNNHNARNLNDALKRFFPELNFTLVAVSRTDPAVSEIGNIEGVKEYKIFNLTENNFIAYASMYADLTKEFIQSTN